jgi:ribonuclease VapC
MSDCVLDASVILLLLHREPGSAKVERLLPGAIASSVNIAEVAGKLAKSGMPETDFRAAIGALGLTIVDFDLNMAFETGCLRLLTRNAGLSIGDRACLATGKVLGKSVVTADRAWAKLNLDIKIRLVR